MSAMADNGIIETARKRRTYKYLTRPAQTSPRTKTVGVLKSHLTFFFTIFGRRWWPRPPMI